MSSRADSVGRPWVTAVVVSHDGEQWIPTLLRALKASSVLPDRIAWVDTGSTDTSRAHVAQHLGDCVVEAPAWTGFGAAVDLGLAANDRPGVADAGGDRTEDDDWLWLLHDDCAPAPDALENLLDTAASDSSIAAVGCRVRAWPRARRLLEVGVSITGTGHRETGLEPGEYDQGQYDAVRTVLAVSSAGMLVRRRIWDLLGGFDDRLPLFRDDVDFGWRVAKAGLRVVVAPDAILFHAEASTRGVRTIANTATSPHRADRRAALFTLLANCGPLTLPWQYARLWIGCSLRALGYLLGKLPSAAYDELTAMLDVVLRPDRILAARSRRTKTSMMRARQLRPLFPPWWTPYLNGLEAVMSRFSRPASDIAAGVTVSSGPLRSGRGDATALERGPVPDEAIDLRVGADPLSWLRSHLLLSLVAGLSLAGLVAARGSLGGGFLQGGALLPAPGGARDWWRLYGETHHAVALGSDLVAAPYVAALGIGGALLLGKAWLVVDGLMLLAAPLSAVGAYLAARRLVESAGVRVWMASTYALVPVLSGSVTTGHVGTVGAAVVLPWLLAVTLAPLGRGWVPSWRRGVAGGLVLAVMTAFAPLAWPMAVALLAVGLAVTTVRRRGRTALEAAAGAVVVGLPLVLLAPWSIRLAAAPRLLLTEAGSVDPSTAHVGDIAWQLPFGRLAASGAAPWWVSAGVIAAALVGIGRRDRRVGVAAAWLVLAVALATAALLSYQSVSIPGGDQRAFAWVGFPVVVAQGAAVVAVGLVADGLVGSLTTGSFGFRQPLVAVVGICALGAPIAGLIWWVVVAPQGDLSRHDVTPLPAYMADTLVSDPSQRALVLRRDGGDVTYDLIVGDGLRLGDDSVLPRSESHTLTDTVGDLLSEAQPSDVGRLAGLGVSYVVLPSPANPGDVAALDGLAGLTRASTDVAELHGWQVSAAASRPRSARADPTTSATTSGQPGFLSENRTWWLVGQAATWLVALVLAAPSLTRRAGISRAEP